VSICTGESEDFEAGEPRGKGGREEIIYCQRRRTRFRVIDSAGVLLNGLYRRVAAALCRRDQCAAGGTAAVAFATENEIIKKLLRGYKLKRGLSARATFVRVRCCRTPPPLRHRRRRRY